MSHYHCQIDLSAPPATVYRALSTQEGLRAWWTQTCEAAESVGGLATFHFGNTRKQMRITELAPERAVHWHCVEAFIDWDRLQRRDEWVGTDIVFTLSPQDGGRATRLDFEHRGLAPALECFQVCSDGWAQYLASLQSLAKTGAGQPFVPAGPCGTSAPAPAAAAAASEGSTDRIERSIQIEAPRARVWAALTQPQAFGSWFGARLEGLPFAPGQNVRGPITIAGYEHVVFDAIIERVEPETLLSYRWHPYAVDAAVDYSQEPRTLVTFRLQEAGSGTLLAVVESGFDRLPPSRRLTALRMNTAGWDAQLRNIQRHASHGL